VEEEEEEGEEEKEEEGGEEEEEEVWCMFSITPLPETRAARSRVCRWQRSCAHKTAP